MEVKSAQTEVRSARTEIASARTEIESAWTRREFFKIFYSVDEFTQRGFYQEEM
jgi:hypothetical protein